MVFVDMSSPAARDYFVCWFEQHGAALDSIRVSLSEWAEESRRAEAEVSRREGRPARPLAVVFDVDEVLLCNIHLNGYKAPAGVQGPEEVDFHVADFFTDGATGARWGRADTGDPPLPGASALLGAAVALGLRPFFVTGRLESIRAETAEDFRRAGFTRSAFAPDAPVRPDDLAETLVMCPDDARPGPRQSIKPWKEGCRAEIAKRYRIVLNLGDQESDLGRHGDRQVLLPHAFYYTA